MTGSNRAKLTWETLREFLRLAGPEQLIEVYLLSTEDSEAWKILREILLLMRHRVPLDKAFEPYRKALDYLYLLTRFVEIHERIPNLKEEGSLVQSASADLRGSRRVPLMSPAHEDDSLVTMESLLRSKMSSVRERLLRRLDRKRKWRDSIGIGIDEYPRGATLLPDESEDIADESEDISES